ncbi:MAG: MBOAT family protein [Rhodocyclaceae bacterium]|nr:MBOAT family protein [Rhodocyclaceae bacterium]
MLFHSPEFIFLFLPVTLIAYFALGRLSWRTAFAWLALASLFFYGWWDIDYVLLILVSITANYLGGCLIDFLGKHERGTLAKLTLGGFVVANLAALAYFKYFTFAAAELSRAFSLEWHVADLILPIGISFYTFTQIAYLVDTSRGKVSERSFVSYLLFVTYFPHLVAGPVLHHSEMMPQFAEPGNLRFNSLNFSRGLAFFSFGLFKKIVFADGCAPLANAAFANPEGLSAIEAWTGAVAYSLQIYFDFSGYSDMAVGLSLMFNINLPVNFNSPYQATSIIDFWRRWHMTLSRFLRDYLYVPLGGSRNGRARRYANLLVTMLLGGLWHGANWTFLVWGGLHGLYLVINHTWRRVDATRERLLPNRMTRSLSWFATMAAVIVAWVFFRAESIEDAVSFVLAMAGEGDRMSGSESLLTAQSYAFLFALGLWAAFAPNTNKIMNYSFGSGERVDRADAKISWQPSAASGAMAGFLLYCAAFVAVAGREKLEFIYFQF